MPDEALTAEQMAKCADIARHCIEYPVAPEMNDTHEGKKADWLSRALLQSQARETALREIENLKYTNRATVNTENALIAFNELNNCFLLACEIASLALASCNVKGI